MSNKNETLTGYEYLAKKTAELGADEVRRVEAFKFYSDWLEDIVIGEYDLMKVPLPSEFLEMVWNGAVDNADKRHEFLRGLDATTKAVGGQQ